MKISRVLLVLALAATTHLAIAPLAETKNDPTSDFDFCYYFFQELVTKFGETQL